MAFVRGHYRRTASGGMAYVRPHTRRSSSSTLEAIIIFVLLALSAIVWVVRTIVAALSQYIAEITIMIGVSCGAAIVGCSIYAAWRALQTKRVTAYLDLCEDLVKDGGSALEKMREVDALAEKLPYPHQYRTFGEEGIYLDFVAQILADGHIDSDEQALLGYLNKRFTIDPMDTRRIKLDAFNSLLNALQSNFDEEDEERLRAVGNGLGLQPGDVERQLQPFIDYRESVRRQQREQAERLAEARRIEVEKQALRDREYRLAAQVYDDEEREPISSSMRLAKKEIGWHETEAVEVKRLKKGDQRRKGKLIITERRLLFVSDGSVTVRLNKILDVAAEFDEKLLCVVKDGRKRPYEFELAHPIVAMAHIERSLAEMG